MDSNTDLSRFKRIYFKKVRSTVKLIVTDMDGSLLDSQKSLPRDFDEVFSKLKERDIPFAIATGRSYIDVKYTMKKWIDQISVIAENGNHIFHHDTCIYTASLDHQVVLDVYQDFKRMKKGILILCGVKAIYRIKDDFAHEEDEKQVAKYYREVTYLDSIECLDDEILKITVCCCLSTAKHIYPTLKSYEEKATVVVSAFEWLDIIKKGESKGKAIKILQDKLGVLDKDTICFGDFLNDASMKTKENTCFAMQNAHPDIKELFDEVILSNDAYGVTLKIKSLLNL